MSSGLRVLHVVRRMYFGGLEMGVVNLIHGLAEQGIAQALCCLEDRGELADRLPASVPVWSCGGASGAQRVPLRAAQFMRSWRPHVVHARNGSAWIDAAAAWLLSGRCGRLAFSVHGWDRLDRLPRGRAFLYRQIARLTTGLAAVSAETARQFAAETGIPERRFCILNSGVDTERFRPAPHRPVRDRFVIGCVGRLDPVKAHDVMIHGFSRVLASGTRDVELHLLGDGPCRPDLERLVQSLQLGGRVRFSGMVSDIPEQLRSIDLFVLSSHREGRPTSIMEAMASGLPVVATRVGSIPDLVEHGRTGLLVPPADSTALAQAIGTLLGDDSLRQRFAESARAVAVAEFSLHRMVRDYLAFYEGMSRVKGNHVSPSTAERKSDVATPPASVRLSEGHASL